MAKLRPRALDCPNCGASIEVRHALKAKSVVCGTCAAQIDLTKPGFEVLSQVGGRSAPPFGPIRLGLHADIQGKQHEVIGRLRLEERDDGDVDAWDEWLLVSQDGSYRWISEEPDRKWALHEPFVPDPPVAPAQLVEGGRVEIGGKRLLVRERGTARVVFLEGELTWKARIGDAIEYADATLGTHGYAFEWSEEEFEAFTIEELTRSELWSMLGLDAVHPAASSHHDRAATFRRTATLLFGAAIVAFVAGFAAPLVRGTVSRSEGDVPVTAADVRNGVQLGSLDLEKGLGFYELETTATMPKGMERYEVALEAPDGKKGEVVRFDHVGTTHARETVKTRFTVPADGAYRMVLKGAEKAATTPGKVRWALYRQYLVARWFTGAGIALLLAALYTFYRAGKEAMAASSLYYGDEEV